MRKRLAAMPLLWRVFATNALVLLVAYLALVFAPITVSVPPTRSEFALLSAGFLGLLAVNLVLLRPALKPLNELADTMRRHDPLSPGKRARVAGGPAVSAVARAFNEMLDRLEHERRQSGRRALLLQEEERLRIARELHDEVGQTLTGVMLQVEALSGRIPGELRPQLDELRETARRGTEDVRRIASQLRPEALDDLGLPSALAALATTFVDQAGISVHRRLEPDLVLSREEELAIYRIAQEALTNVARHAGARRVDLRLERSPGGVRLLVRDDGRGLPEIPLSVSHGIRGMRERAMLIDGRLTITAGPGGGTEVTLTIPVATNPE